MVLSGMDESYIYGKRLILREARNEILVLEDEKGHAKEYLDLMSAYGSCNFGHCNPSIQPYSDYSADIAACFYPQEAYQFSDWLVHKLSLPNHQVMFQVGGSLAVSSAISMALHMRKGKIVYVEGSFHGLGLDSLCATSVHQDYAFQNTQLTESLKEHFVMLPPNMRLQEIGIGWDEVSCFIFEPIQGANGYISLPHQWLSETVKEAKRQGVIVISDEIQCGYYRHGHFSVAHSLELNVDLYLFSKSLTNGMFPFSCVVFPKRFSENLNQPFYLVHTFQTSALGCYAAMETARYIDANDISSKCEKLEKEFRYFADVIGQDLTNIHITGPTMSFEVKGIPAREIVQECLKEGILVFTGGGRGQRVRIAPPVTMGSQSLKEALNIIGRIASQKRN
ncbi:Ornithine aminotransferase [compost metagenome]